MKELFFIGFGGAAGAIARHTWSSKISAASTHPFPLGTLVVNSAGALVFGFLLGALNANIVPESLRPLIGVGFLGAFTTFSTLSVETMQLLRSEHWKFGLLNLVLHVVIGLTLAVFGLISAEKLFAH